MELRVGLHLAKSNSRRLGSISKTQKKLRICPTMRVVEVTGDVSEFAMLPAGKVFSHRPAQGFLAAAANPIAENSEAT